MPKDREPMGFLLTSAAMMISLVLSGLVLFALDTRWIVLIAWVQLPLFVVWLFVAAICVPSVKDSDEKRGYVAFSLVIGTVTALQYAYTIYHDLQSPQ